MREFVIILSKESDVSEVRLELNLADTFSIRNNVSGSTTTGVIEATVNGPRSVTNRAFCEAVKLVPVVDLIDMKTFPNSCTELTPVTGLKEPLSPPQIDTACVFGKNLFTNVF
jgi:hypothetical protein